MRCNVCNEDKEENQFQTYWHSTQKTTRTRRQCNKCFYGNRMKNNNPEKYYQDKPEYKKCIGCNEYKLIKKDFYTTSEGKIYLIRCKSCEMAKVKQERIEYLKSNCGSDQIKLKPNTYTDEYQRECTFAIMERLGYVYDTITGIWTKDGWKEIKDGKPYFPLVKGRKLRTPGVRVTKELYDKMVELRELGYSYQMIANELGVSNTNAFKYINNYYVKKY